MPTVFEAPATTQKRTSVKPVTEKPSTAVGPFTTFAVSPQGVRFETQEADEEVILFMRQHFVVNIPWILLTLLLLVAPTIVFPLFFRVLTLPFPVPPQYIVVAFALWYLATFGFALSKFLGWFFNIYIVTDERVVDIDFVHLLYKQFSEARLTHIEDVSYNSGGIFATVFNYGNVHIQTAAEVPVFEFASIPHPDRVVETIGELVEHAT